jgi:hypothetical protein
MSALMCRTIVTSAHLCVLAFSLSASGVLAGAPESGRWVHFGPVGPVTHPPGVHPMFTHWVYFPHGPLVCRFNAKPDTSYQVFVGLTEEAWDKPGQRIIDIEVAGKVLATVDTFNGAKGRPHGRLFPATSNAEGELTVRLLPNPASPDKNPAACGVLLFPADAKLDVDTIIANRGPKPLVEVLGANAGAEFYANRGKYFAKKAYDPKPLPKFAETKDKLPSPIYDEDPACVDMYWKAWELAFRNFHEPAKGSGYVSQFIDAAFNANIFQWDTCFMTMFCNYAQPYVPGIRSLDNFYCKQFEDGEICREIVRDTGREFEGWVDREGQGLRSNLSNFKVTYVGREAPQPPPHLMLDALDHPIFGWAEMESYRIAGDRQRLALVYDPLARYYRAFQKYLRQGNGLYMTDWASMDNSPRVPFLDRGGTAVDTSCEMVLFARNLAEMADLLDKKDEARSFRAEADELAKTINEKMWDPQRKFYFDLTVDGRRAPIKTIAAFWTLLAGVAGPEQIEALTAELRNPKTFARKHRVPTTPADEPAFKPAGGYWQGSVWAPTNTMVIRGLEQNGQPELAREIALEHLTIMRRVFQDTGTIWENYAPDAVKQGDNAARDFVGWSGLGPILYLIEYGIGVRVDAPANTITWDIRSPRRAGVERLWFGGKTVSLVCEQPDAQGRRKVRVQGDGAFRLKLVCGSVVREADVAAGETREILLEPRNAAR